MARQLAGSRSLRLRARLALIALVLPLDAASLQAGPPVTPDPPKAAAKSSKPDAEPSLKLGPMQRSILPAALPPNDPFVQSLVTRATSPRARPAQDDIYAAYQRGFVIEAFAMAVDRAGSGDPQAMTLVAHLYESGQGIRLSLERAAMWYGFAAARGDREAQVALGLMYLGGRGVKQDKARARDLFTAAAEQKQPVAMYNLAVLMIEGEVVRYDRARVRDLMRGAAELGNADAAYAYAAILDQDEEPGTAEESAKWLGEAAKSGHIAAEIEYAIRLINGRGAGKDMATAVKYLIRAAWSGNPVAQNRLAHLEARGMGVDYNPVDAIKWHLLAKAGGVPDIDLEDLQASLTDEERTRALQLAARWPDPGDDLRPGSFQSAAPDKASPTPAADTPSLRGPLDLPNPAAATPATP